MTVNDSEGFAVGPRDIQSGAKAVMCTLVPALRCLLLWVLMVVNHNNRPGGIPEASGSFAHPWNAVATGRQTLALLLRVPSINTDNAIALVRDEDAFRTVFVKACEAGASGDAAAAVSLVGRCASYVDDAERIVADMLRPADGDGHRPDQRRRCRACHQAVGGAGTPGCRWLESLRSPPSDSESQPPAAATAARQRRGKGRQRRPSSSCSSSSASSSASMASGESDMMGASNSNGVAGVHDDDGTGRLVALIHEQCSAEALIAGLGRASVFPDSTEADAPPVGADNGRDVHARVSMRDVATGGVGGRADQLLMFGRSAGGGADDESGDGGLMATDLTGILGMALDHLLGRSSADGGGGGGGLDLAQLLSVDGQGLALCLTVVGTFWNQMLCRSIAPSAFDSGFASMSGFSALETWLAPWRRSSAD